MIGNAVAPAGYKILEELDSESELNELIGKTLLCGHEKKDVTGWFKGTVHRALAHFSSVHLKATAPTANFVIKYTKADTKTKHLVGTVACAPTGLVCGGCFSRHKGVSTWPIPQPACRYAGSRLAAQVHRGRVGECARARGRAGGAGDCDAARNLMTKLQRSVAESS